MQAQQNPDLALLSFFFHSIYAPHLQPSQELMLTTEKKHLLQLPLDDTMQMVTDIFSPPWEDKVVDSNSL